MNIDTELICTSNYLNNHSILQESLNYRIRYINILEYFVNKYSIKDKFALNMLKTYKQRLLLNDISKYEYTNHNLKTKIKKSRVFKYRYLIIYDCLYINSMNNKEKSFEIFNEIKSTYSKIFHNKLDTAYELFFSNDEYLNLSKYIKYPLECIRKNRLHLDKKEVTLLTTATMSAGKSTLINALIGKSVNKTMNDSCTAKIHYIHEKAYEDGFNYKLDKVLNLDATYEDLKKDSVDNEEESISVSTYFRMAKDTKKRLCIVDTPGVNSSIDKYHSHITEEFITNSKYNKLLYVINAQNFGSDDDLKHLKFVLSKVEHNNILFILNKLDSFRLPEDSIKDCINNLREDLVNLGVDNPNICPVSSYAGYLAKLKMYDEIEDEDQEYECKFLQNKFNRKQYSLLEYYPQEIQDIISKKYAESSKDKSINLLINCGILCLEETIVGGV